MAETDARSLSPRRKWVTVGAATVVEAVAFWSIIIGMARATAEEGAEVSGSAAGAFALGFALVPFAFLVLAFGTNNPRAPGATLRAMGFWAVLGLPLMIFVEPATGMALGFGLGAIPAIRLEPEDSWRARLWWVVAFVGYVFVLVYTEVAAGPGALSASLLPFATVAFADWASEQMREGREQQA
ncbi:MAG: hypothetical protein KQH83_08845 [Actinobacteria bacterium]|nr:hypothetical protein [Actinomycetota bacterium]